MHLYLFFALQKNEIFNYSKNTIIEKNKQLVIFTHASFN